MDTTRNGNTHSVRVQYLARSLPHLLVALLICIYVSIQYQHFTPAYQEVDPDGYLFLAKRMARFQSPAVKDGDPFIHQTHQWVETPDGRVTAKFSPGYPLLMAFFYRVGGDEAMFLVSPVMGALGLVGAYLLFLCWMSPLSASLATWALGMNPMYLIYTGYLLTHAANTCFVTWGMFFLWRWLQQSTTRNALVAGLLLGYAATIRQTSALMGGVLATAILSVWLPAIDWRRFPRLRSATSQAQQAKTVNTTSVLRSGFILLAAYSLFPILLAVYDWSLFGNPFVTGYGLTHEQDAFAWDFFRRNVPTMLGGLNTTALYLIFPVGLAGMFLVGTVRERVMRILWFLPLVLLYTSYYWAPSGMPYLRFTIVTFPVVIGSAFLGLDRLVQPKADDPLLSQRRMYRVNQGILILLLVALMYVRYGEAQAGMRGVVSDAGSRATARTGRMLAHTLDSDAVIFSQRPFFCQIGTRENFRLYDLSVFGGFSGSFERRQPVRTERLKAFYESLDDAGKLQKKRDLIRSFLDQNRQVVFLIPLDSLTKEQDQLGPGFKFTLMREWQPVKEGAVWGLYRIARNELGR